MADNHFNESVTCRNELLLEQLVLVDGQPGCGKSLFSSIIAGMERVELLNYSVELENLCALNYLGKITKDAVMSMIRIQMDLVIYETMMSRRVNFRLGDVSSVFRDVDWLSYLKRLFQNGDEIIPAKILKEKPILHFATHNILAFSEPIFDSLDGKVTIVEVVRHPLYMLIQQTLNQINWNVSANTARQFHLFIKHGNQQVPFWNHGQEELYLQSKPVERAIFEMQKLTELTEIFKKQKLGDRDVQVLTVPFEAFVLDPWSYLQKIGNLLRSKITSRTKRITKKQNIPRTKLSDGISLAFYKKRGWEPPVKGFSEKEELIKRREYAVKQGAQQNAMKILDEISKQYEEKYLMDII